MSNTRGAFCVSRWDVESNEDVYASFGMAVSVWGVDCGMTEWVDRGTLRWFEHADNE